MSWVNTVVGVLGRTAVVVVGHLGRRSGWSLGSRPAGRPESTPAGTRVNTAPGPGSRVTAVAGFAGGNVLVVGCAAAAVAGWVRTAVGPSVQWPSGPGWVLPSDQSSVAGTLAASAGTA